MNNYASYDIDYDQAININQLNQVPAQNDLGNQTVQYVSDQQQQNYNQILTQQNQQLSNINQMPQIQENYTKTPILTQVPLSSQAPIQQDNKNLNKLLNIYNYLSILTNNNTVMQYLKKENKLSEMDDIAKLHDTTVSYLNDKLIKLDFAKKSPQQYVNELDNAKLNDIENENDDDGFISTEVMIVIGVILLYIIYSGYK